MQWLLRVFFVVNLPVLISQERDVAQCFSKQVLTDPVFIYITLGFITIVRDLSHRPCFNAKERVPQRDL